MRNFFVILGGMGTLASESFVHQLNQKTPATCDQDYCNYILANHATIPDRTDYIIGKSQDNPLDSLQEDIEQLSALAPDFFVLTCNTAHYFHDQLQAMTDIPILHMPRIAVQAIPSELPHSAEQPLRVSVLGTEGTMKIGVYQQAVEAQGYQYCPPSADLQAKITHFIYHEVKGHKRLNVALLEEIIRQAQTELNCDVVILGCTELSYVYAETDCFGGNPPLPIIDAQGELVSATLARYTHPHH